MKFNFWLELPTAILSLLSENVSNNDIEIANNLLNTCKSIEYLTNGIQKEIEIIINTGNFYHISNQINNLKNRLTQIEKEKSVILIQAIKFSVKLSSNFITSIKQNKDSFYDHIQLTKIKYFLNLIKNCINQLDYHLEKRNGSFVFSCEQESELTFCKVIKIYFEKVESKLYNTSVQIINNSFEDVKTKKKRSMSYVHDSKPEDNPTPYSTPQMKLLRLED